MKKYNNLSASRRKFLRNTTALAGLSLVPESIKNLADMNKTGYMSNTGSEKSIIGGYGLWADGLMEKPAELSYRNNEWKRIDSWQKEALRKAREIISPPDLPGTPKASRPCRQ
jgi:hypothetical protein